MAGVASIGSMATNPEHRVPHGSEHNGVTRGVLREESVATVRYIIHGHRHPRGEPKAGRFRHGGSVMHGRYSHSCLHPANRRGEAMETKEKTI